LQTEHVESVKPELTLVPIWRCRNKECKAWIREELSNPESPECPLCRGAMVRSLKHLPKLAKKVKSQKKAKAADAWVH
jgi:hypothetical protein